MSLESVRHFFAEHAPDVDIIEMPDAELALRLHDVEPGQLAKTLSFKVKDKIVLIVTRGDARLDNDKLKATLGRKVRMLCVDEVVNLTGHPARAVSPFGLENPLTVYCDVSLRSYDEVLPAAGSIYNAVRISPQRMADLTAAKWIDVCESF